MKIPAIQFLPVAIADRHRLRQQRAGGILAGRRANELLARIDRATGATAVVELMADWADDRSRSGSWSLTIREHARLAGISSPSLRRQEEIIRGQWCQLGTCLVERFHGITEDAETLGALLHEIAYAPAMTFMSTPTAEP